MVLLGERLRQRIDSALAASNSNTIDGDLKKRRPAWCSQASMQELGTAAHLELGTAAHLEHRAASQLQGAQQNAPWFFTNIAAA